MQIKPFDIIICEEWLSVAIELKVCNLKKWVSYEQAYSMLRPNQIWALSAHNNAMWISYIVVWKNAEEKEYSFPFKLLDNIDVWEL